MDDYNVMVLDRDTVELLFNDQLSNRPYLIRLKNDYGEMYEMRCDKEELRWLSGFLNKTLENTQ